MENKVVMGIKNEGANRNDNVVKQQQQQQIFQHISISIYWG